MLEVNDYSHAVFGLVMFLSKSTTGVMNLPLMNVLNLMGPKLVKAVFTQAVNKF